MRVTCEALRNDSAFPLDIIQVLIAAAIQVLGTVAPFPVMFLPLCYICEHKKIITVLSERISHIFYNSGQ